MELSHEIDYLSWIFGPIQKVFANLSKRSNLRIDVEDSALLTLQFTPDMDAVPVSALVNLDFIRQDRKRSCLVVGEKGSLLWDGIEGTVHEYKDSALGWELYFSDSKGISNTYYDEWSHFIDCIIGKDQPVITGEDGLRVLEVLEALRASNEQACQIEIKRDFLN